MTLRKWINIVEASHEENEEEHGRALKQTGFWGKKGAGCIFFAKETGRFLIAHRSDNVEQPGTWGCWGGAIDSGEDPQEAVKREAYEEAGYKGELEIVPLYVFRKNTFQYSNFLAIVDTEFKPRLNWESQGYIWCKWGEWPKPLHFGLVSLFKDPASAQKMKSL